MTPLLNSVARAGLFVATMAFMLAGCVDTAPSTEVPTPAVNAGTPVETPGTDTDVTDHFAWWEAERARRQRELDAYLDANREGLESLLYAPLGSFGVPRRAIDRFSDVMPDIWGPPEEKFAAVGLGPDLYNPSNPLPLGIAPFTIAGVEYGVISCGTCHVGRVRGPDGKDMLLIGAPNTRMNSIFNAFEQSAVDPRWAKLNAGPIAEAVRVALIARRQAEKRALLDFTFSKKRNTNAPDPFAINRPGFFDSFAMIFATQVLVEAVNPIKFLTNDIIDSVMPPNPSEADVMSVFLQRDRPAAEWDGSMPHAVYRNLAASVGTVALGAAVNYKASEAAAAFTRDLPPPPYPFPVDEVRAKRGEMLFNGTCARCHYASANTIYTPAVTGTDPNRAHAITVEGRKRLITALRTACTDPATCKVPDEDILVDVSNPSSLGYLALPLNGIWSRAPYLHNGSVPTLRHLLLPKTRPTTFTRGAATYDTDAVGFAWDTKSAAQPYTHTFDTRLAGRSNRGHDTLMFLGRDWAKDPEALADLLEFMKTL